MLSYQTNYEMTLSKRTSLNVPIQWVNCVVELYSIVSTVVVARKKMSTLLIVYYIIPAVVLVIALGVGFWQMKKRRDARNERLALSGIYRIRNIFTK